MGRWQEQHPAVWETVVTPCDCCGQVVARQDTIITRLASMAGLPIPQR